MHEAAFLLQEQNLQQVADLLCVGNDGVPNSLTTVPLDALACRFKHRQFTLCGFAVGLVGHPQRPGVAQGAQQHILPLDFVQLPVGAAQLRGLQQFAHSGFVLV